MPNTVNIRAATIDDAKAIAEVHVRSWQHAYRDLLPAIFLASLSLEKREALWTDSLTTRRSSLLVAEADNKVVGFSAFGPCRDEGAGPTDYELWALYLAPDYWSSGLGRELWLKSRKEMAATGASLVSLWVLEGNDRAIRFYAAAGFHPQLDSAKAFELGGVPVREIRYVNSMPAMNARQYNERTMKGLFRKIYPVIAEQAITRTGIRAGLCIDLGGGPGMLGICVGQASDLRVVIVDPLPECIELACENIAEHGLGHRVAAQGGQAEALPFADCSIDLVVSRGSIYFWHDQRRGLREVFRVLRPGGWAYIGGGFGNKELRDEILAEKANDADWNRQRAERGSKHPPEHFRALLTELAIDGEVETGDEGMWIVFRKPRAQS
jgi:ubiquinone/menaquinone biosynthesis C-methylase UbiE/ribosomal protein S18 acetylase RimI-like enzyme